jgi:hypothetical protein
MLKGPLASAHSALMRVRISPCPRQPSSKTNEPSGLASSVGCGERSSVELILRQPPGFCGSRMERSVVFSAQRFDIISSKPTVGMGTPRASQPPSGG